MSPVPVTDVIHHARGVDRTIGVHGDVLYPEIDVDNILGIVLLCVRHITGRREVELAFSEGEGRIRLFGESKVLSDIRKRRTGYGCGPGSS